MPNIHETVTQLQTIEAYGSDSKGTPSDVAALMEARSFMRVKSKSRVEQYQRGKNDRVLTVIYADGVVSRCTVTNIDGSKDNKVKTFVGWKGLYSIAQAYGD